MRIFYLKKMLNKTKRYLKNGTYIFNKNYTQLFNNSAYNSIGSFINSFETCFSEKLTISTFLKKIMYSIFFGNKIKIKNKTTEFEGELVLIPSNNYGIKIFSKNKVLTQYNDENYLNHNLNSREKISFIFNTPKVCSFTTHTIIEEKINSKEFDKEEVLYYILNSYIDYFKNNNIKLKKYYEIHKNNIKDFYKNNNFLKFNEKIFFEEAVLQHGDLWSGNIIFDGNKYYVIDFEKVDEKYFLNDFFLYLYIDLDITKDSYFLNNYFNGKYDDILNKYCNSLEINYKKEKKKEYFESFLYYFIYENFSNYNKKELEIKLKDIEELIGKYL